ncbi:HNH endonuclease signature motif containing protein [Georgenia muralis]|uniref:Uncharacterized protein DUF222 n=1 Tax=Georgenia muralis TaxID=154117 RepID=A0A3N4ZUP1_9MICO|nr:HNH endonuclease signature motif containing protein [Georgenia muralis]RPF29138.1 uncharacterized protein DUF222 [Georgenia muralis]
MSSRRGRKIDLAAARARGWDSLVEAYLAEIRDAAHAHTGTAGATPTPVPAAGPRRLRLVDAVYAEPVELAVAFLKPDSDADAGLDTGAEPDTTVDTGNRTGTDPEAEDEAEDEAEAEDTGMPTAEEITAAAAVLARAAGLYGAPLATALDQVPAQGQDPSVLIELVAHWNRVISWSTARRGEAAAALADAAAEHARHTPGPTVDPVTVAATEISMRLTTTKQAATRMITTATMLTGPLTATGASLEHGAIDPVKAQIIADALHHIPHQIAWDIEDAVLPGAQGRTPAQLRRDLTHALIAADHHHAEDRHRRARTTRRVCHPKALPDGMASLYAVLPAEDAIAIDLTLDNAARHAKATGDTRTLDQLRADTLATIAVNALTTGEIHFTVPAPDQVAGTAHTPTIASGPAPGQAAHDSPTPPSRAPSPGSAPGPVPLTAIRLGTTPVTILVTIPLTTLLGGGEPAVLDGYGPIDPVTARALALGGTWRRLVTDPLTGAVLDHGRTRYRPPKDLADLVRARDRTCIRPACNTPATRCELDHSLAWSQGGTTALTNLGSACDGDHDLKTCGHFAVRQITNGVFEWTSALTGHTYRREQDGSVTYLNPHLPRQPRTDPQHDPTRPTSTPPY